jgi:hypothetical protein
MALAECQLSFGSTAEQQVSSMNNKKIVKIKESPEFWYNGIVSLPEEIRATVAKVVWWDHFAQQLVSQRWPHLDEWLNKPVIQIETADWVKYLTKIGYTEYEAATRCIEQRGSGRSRNPAPGSGGGNGYTQTSIGTLGGKVQENNDDCEPVLEGMCLSVIP